MGNINKKRITDEQKSNSSVLNLSLESNKDLNSNTCINDNYSDFINDLKKEVTIPIENEYIESSEFILDNKEEEFKIKFFLDNKYEIIDNYFDSGIYNKKRSKTYVPNISIKKTPKPHPKESNEYISPLKLSIKSYGNNHRWNKNTNAVLYDFQKNIIECKSYNEEDCIDDFFLFNVDTERSTPNVEDLQHLLDCRKKMTIFRNSINERNIKEYENILNSDYIFNEPKEETNNFHSKKNNFWYKHIKQQLLRDKAKSLTHSTRISSDPVVKRYESSDKIDDNKKEHGLFILGILESAANEKKGRNTVNA